MPLEVLQSQETTIFDDVEFNSITGQLDANNEIITNVAGPPVSNNDGVNKQYVDDNISGVTTGFLKADGTIPMIGNLDLGTNNIINVVDPTNPQDVATKNYTDTNTSNNNYLLKTGGTMTGSINYNGFDMTNVKRILNGTAPPNNRRVIIGNDDVQAGLYGVSLGEDAGKGTSGSSSVISIGKNSGRNNGSGTVSIGVDAGVDGSGIGDAVAIGCLAGRDGFASNAVIVGANSRCKGQRSVVIGPSSRIDSTLHTDTVLLGANALSTEANQIIIKANTNIIQADSGGLTYNSNNIEGDFKADGSVSMTSSLDLGTNNIINVLFLNGLSVTGGKYAMTQGVTYSTTGVGTYGSIIGVGSGDRNTPANTFQFGTSFHIKTGGIFTCSNNNLLRFRFMGGVGSATEVYLTAPITCNGAVTGGAWELEVEATVQTLGDILTGSIAFNGNFIYTNSGANYVGGTFSATSLPFNTEIDNLIDIQTSLESAGMSLTSHTCIINKSY